MGTAGFYVESLVSEGAVTRACVTQVDVLAELVGKEVAQQMPFSWLRLDGRAYSSSNPNWSNLRVAAFSLIVRTTWSGMPSGTVAWISKVISTSDPTRALRC